MNDVKKGLNYKGKNLLLIKYEDLIYKFEDTVKKICKFISIKYDQQMVNYHTKASIKRNVAFENFKVSSLQKDRNLSYNNTNHKKRISKIYSNKELLKIAKNLDYNIS